MPDFADVAIDTARQLKEDLVRREGVGSDLQPLLVLIRDDVIQCLVMLDTPAHDVVHNATALTDADVVAMIVESFTHTGDDAGSATYAPGELARRFGAGDPAVRETLVVVVWSEGGGAEMRMQPYRYAGRTMVWEDLGDVDVLQAVGGAYDDAVMAGFAARATRPIPAVPPRLLSGFIPGVVVLE